MLIKKDPDLIQPYLEDYSNIKKGFCDGVCLPESEKEVVSFISSAAREGTQVTISAAGTGVTGARIPFGGYALSVEKLNKIKGFERLASGEGIATVEPGVVLKDFLQRVKEQDFFYPPDPTEKSSFIGGNIATSASGSRSFRFGTSRDYVLGLRVVLSNGDILDLQRGRIYADRNRSISLALVSGNTLKIALPTYTMPAVKNAAGYYAGQEMDAIDIFIGQEGTLGIITEIRLRLLKSLKGLLGCYAFFNKQKDGLAFAYRARDMSLKNRSRLPADIDAISLEFFDKNALRLLREKHKNIPPRAESAIYFEQELRKELESALLDAWAGLIAECGGSLDNTWFAQNEKELDRLQDIRHDLPDMVNEFLKRHNQTKIGTDIAVSPSHIDEMINCYDDTLSEAGLTYVIFGHIGDSHMHVNILPESEAQSKKAKQFYELFVKKAVSLGGTVSAEHGIGKLKHRYLEVMYGKQAIEEMVRLKRQLDPPCILGLDNIFPRELLKITNAK